MKSVIYEAIGNKIEEGKERERGRSVDRKEGDIKKCDLREE